MLEKQSPRGIVAGQLDIRIRSVGRHAPWPQTTIFADPGLVEIGGIVERDTGAKDRQQYRIEQRRTVVDEAGGSIRLEIDVRSTRRWFDPLDEFVERRDGYIIIIVIMSVLSVLSLVAVPLYWHLQNAAGDRYLVGFLLAKSPWPLFFAVLISYELWTISLRPYIGFALSYAASVPAIFLAIAVSIFWYRFISSNLVPATPPGYAHLALAFWHSARTQWAFVAAYSPVILILLKLAKLSALGELISLLPAKRKTD